jgi:hypothetical protein
MNPTTFAAIRTRLDRLEKKRPRSPRLTLFDAIAGVAPLEQLPVDVVADLQAAVCQEGHDRVEERMEAALSLPYGLRELKPSLPGTEPAPTLNRLGGEPSSNGAGYHA